MPRDDDLRAIERRRRAIWQWEHRFLYWHDADEIEAERQVREGVEPPLADLDWQDGYEPPVTDRSWGNDWESAVYGERP